MLDDLAYTSLIWSDSLVKVFNAEQTGAERTPGQHKTE